MEVVENAAHPLSCNQLSVYSQLMLYSLFETLLCLDKTFSLFSFPGLMCHTFCLKVLYNAYRPPSEHIRNK
jgi:hypothetical protein